ncbi:MAG TPA: serine/threonine-protein kinase [Nannocystaceae bacterium]|nr:serine/threonine-protein kinase [Nannocystaceae bacterium]
MSMQLKTGDDFAGFHIHRVLRKLPSEWVYLATSTEGALVDLKVSLDPVGSQAAAARVLRELAVLERLTNRHVARVLASGLGPAEHWFLATEHLEGAQLHHWHDFDVPLATADAVGFVHDACLGLAELHAHGIVHRALEPSRLWIDDEHTLKILDFGSARSWNAEPTGTNVTIGTTVIAAPPYVAPEQVRGAELTPATDVYSLAVILYELLSGRSPFFPGKSWRRARAELADDPSAWLRAHVKIAAAPLAEHAPRLSTRLCALVDRCLAKDPALRPRDAAELANELGWILHTDLGARAAVLSRRGPDAPASFQLIVPGSHRLDVHGAPIAGDEPAFVLDWDGGSRPAEVVPEAARVDIDGHPITARTAWLPGARLHIGKTELTLAYPRER